MGGKELLEELIMGTHLPEEPLSRELNRLLDKANIPQDSCNLEMLREILAEYAQEILVEARKAYTK